MKSFGLEELVGRAPRFAQRRTARFQDVDAAGIVFYPRIVEYFHDAYMELLAARGISVAEVLAKGTWGAPIKRVEAQFLRPIRFEDALEVGIVAARAEDNHVLFGYRIDRGAEAVAVGQSEHVFVDAAKFQRIPLPEVMARILASLG